MSYFALNILLAGAYILLTQDLSALGLLIALAIGYIITALVARARGHGGYSVRLYRVFHFLCYFFYILVKANLIVAWEIITPGFNMKPRIIRYPVAGLTDVEITTLANAITLTPGTLSADIDEDTRTLYIHCMYAQDRETAIAELDELRNRLLREVFDHDV